MSEKLLEKLEEPLKEKLNLKDLVLQPNKDSYNIKLSKDININFTWKSSNYSWDESWKISIIFEIWSFKFEIVGIPSGCGAGIIRNLYSNENHFNAEERVQLKEILLYILTLRKNTWGSIITTYGKQFKSSFPYEILEEIGFKELSTYPNYQHGSNGEYKQSLLQLLL